MPEVGRAMGLNCHGLLIFAFCLLFVCANIVGSPYGKAIINKICKNNANSKRDLTFGRTRQCWGTFGRGFLLSTRQGRMGNYGPVSSPHGNRLFFAFI